MMCIAEKQVEREDFVLATENIQNFNCKFYPFFHN